MTFEETLVEVGVLRKDVGRGAAGKESFRNQFLEFCAGGVLVQ